MKKLILAASVLILASAANAQQASKSNARNVYGEIGFHRAQLEVADGFNATHNLVTGIVGYQFHPNLSAELLLGAGMGSQTDNVGPLEVNTKIDNTFALMLRPSWRFNEKLEGFVRLGYGRTKASVDGMSGSASSPVLGVGVNWYFTPELYGQLSYTSFHNKDEVKAEGVGVSIGYKF